MNPVAGAIIYAGALLGAVVAYFRAGGGMAGYYAAREYFITSFPTATAQTIDALAARASQTAAAGGMYESLPPGTAPNPANIPDMRPIERRAGVVTPGPNGEYPPATVFTQVQVTIHEAGFPDRIWFRVPFNIPAGQPVDNDLIRAIAEEYAQSGIRQFIDSPTVQARQREFETSVTIIGAYRGY